MMNVILRIVMPAAIIFAVSEVSRRSPRLAVILLTLPLVSILAFAASWSKDHDLRSISQMAKETLILVPLGLPFFLPLAFADRLGLSFWSAMLAGLILASITIGAWLAYGPR